MEATILEIRGGTYYDSVVLMQLQLSLAKLPGVLDAGVMMGTEANKALLAQSNLLPPEARSTRNDDLILVIRGEDTNAAQKALAQVDTLLSRRRSVTQDQEYLPQSVESASKRMPHAQWVLVSVPGRYAAGVARDALRLGKNVFLYSDNVSLKDEIALKQIAAQKGLLVMGPDCGTAIVNGVGLGFANRVRRGPIGLVAASGTGLQAVTASIHNMGSGITHALGTGGRDLSRDVGAMTARQGLDLLSRDPETKVIVLISKPPAQEVADQLLSLARSAGKPVVVYFIGYAPPAKQVAHLHFATTFDETAAIAIKLATDSDDAVGRGDPLREMAPTSTPFAAGQRYLRGLFSGGTLAYEAMLILSGYLSVGATAKVCPYSNAPLDKRYQLKNSLKSQEHTIIDLGEDEFTVGRPHPMMDNRLRIQRLEQEADDPEVALLLLDVVLGDGAHPDPASELAPAIVEAKERAAKAGRHLEVVTLVIGTDEDPQGLDSQIQQLEAAGAHVETSSEAGIHLVGQLLQPLIAQSDTSSLKEVDLSVLQQPLAAINVGLEIFTESLTAQGAEVLQVNWRPPAGGNERLMSILARMKGR